MASAFKRMPLLSYFVETMCSTGCRFILQLMWEENLGTQAGVLLIEGVHLIWGPLNTGSTVVLNMAQPSLLLIQLLIGTMLFSSKGKFEMKLLKVGCLLANHLCRCYCEFLCICM